MVVLKHTNLHIANQLLFKKKKLKYCLSVLPEFNNGLCVMRKFWFKGHLHDRAHNTLNTNAINYYVKVVEDMDTLFLATSSSPVQEGLSIIHFPL